MLFVQNLLSSARSLSLPLPALFLYIFLSSTPFNLPHSKVKSLYNEVLITTLVFVLYEGRYLRQKKSTKIAIFTSPANQVHKCSIMFYRSLLFERITRVHLFYFLRYSRVPPFRPLRKIKTFITGHWLVLEIEKPVGNVHNARCIYGFGSCGYFTSASCKNSPRKTHRRT